MSKKQNAELLVSKRVAAAEVKAQVQRINYLSLALIACSFLCVTGTAFSLWIGMALAIVCTIAGAFFMVKSKMYISYLNQKYQLTPQYGNDNI